MASICTGPSVLDWACVYAGDRNAQEFEFLADGVPWDLTGAVLSAQARKSRSDPAAALTATVTAVDAALGTWIVEWDGDDVRTLLGTAESWEGVWDLQVLEVGQTLPVTVLKGTFRAELDVTRAP
jgi:alkaline phosphatase